MSTYAKNMSTRLFIQGAITAALGMQARGWVTVVVMLGVIEAAAGLAIRSVPVRARAIVIGVEAVAVPIGLFGLVGGHYIPGTIIGIVTLITAATHDAPAPDAAVGVPPYGTPAPAGFPAIAPAGAPVVAAMAPVAVADPYVAPPAPVAFHAPVTAAAPVAVATPPVATAAVEPAPVVAAPAPFDPDRTAPRAMTILPGR